MTNLDERIYSMIDEEIDELINSAETKAIMRGYYTAWAKILHIVKKTSNSEEEANDKMANIAHEAFGYTEFYGCEAEFVPLVLLRDYLEDYCRERLLPKESGKAYDIIEECLDTAEWCDVASSLSDEFDKLI